MAMKSTYLFVYPRLLLVDVRKNRKAFIANVQMERSWLDNHTTESSANRLAGKVSKELKRLIAQKINCYYFIKKFSKTIHVKF